VKRNVYIACDSIIIIIIILMIGGYDGYKDQVPRMRWGRKSSWKLRRKMWELWRQAAVSSVLWHRNTGNFREIFSTPTMSATIYSVDATIYSVDATVVSDGIWVVSVGIWVVSVGIYYYFQNPLTFFCWKPLYSNQVNNTV